MRTQQVEGKPVTYVSEKYVKDLGKLDFVFFKTSIGFITKGSIFAQWLL